MLHPYSDVEIMAIHLKANVCHLMLPRWRPSDSGAPGKPAVALNVSLVDAMNLEKDRAKVNLEVALLEFGQLKEVSGGKNSGGKGPRRVLALTVADEEMVAQIELWNEVGQRSESIISQAFENVHAEDQYPMLRLSDVERVELARAPSLVVKFQSTRATVVAAMQPRTLKIVPSSTMMTTVFDGMNKPDLHGNLMGIVSAVGELFHSKAGRPMRDFVLQGRNGKSLRIMMHGAWATDTDLIVGQRVAVYYAQSLAGIKGASGFFWCYDEGFVLMLGRTVVPENGTVLEIPTEKEELWADQPVG